MRALLSQARLAFTQGGEGENHGQADDVGDGGTRCRLRCRAPGDPAGAADNSFTGTCTIFGAPAQISCSGILDGAPSTTYSATDVLTSQHQTSLPAGPLSGLLGPDAVTIFYGTGLLTIGTAAIPYSYLQVSAVADPGMFMFGTQGGFAYQASNPEVLVDFSG